MPTNNCQPKEALEPEDLIISLLPTIPKTVNACFQDFSHYASQEESEELTEQIVVFLIAGGYRSFEGRSAIETWLYTVIKRRVGKYLRTKRSDLNLDEAPPDQLAHQADLDDEILFKERLALVLKIAETELTKHECELLDLVRRGLNPSEMAQEMGIKVASARREKSALLKKLRELVEREIGGRGGRKRGKQKDEKS